MTSDRSIADSCCDIARARKGAVATAFDGDGFVTRGARAAFHAVINAAAFSAP